MWHISFKSKFLDFWQSPTGLGFAVVEGPGFGGGQTGIYVKDITEGGPAQKVPDFFCLVTFC